MTEPVDELTERLERDYRRLLGWYPRSWRALRGDVLVGTAMDTADAEDRFLLRRGERREFAAAGMEARLDRLVTGDVRHIASTVLLALGAGSSFAWFLLTSWAPLAPGAASSFRGFGPFFDAEPVLAALWLLALVAALTGRWRLGRIALTASVVAGLLIAPMERVLAPSAFFALNPAALAFFIACALLTMLGTPRAGLPLTGAVAGWAAVAAALWLLQAEAYPERPANVFSSLNSSPEYLISVTLIALGAAAVLAVARFWSAAFTILLTTIPFTAAIDAAFVFTATLAGWWVISDFAAALLTLNAATLLGLLLLGLSSRSAIRLPARPGPTTT